MNKFTALIGTAAALAMPFAANAQTFSGNANGSSGSANLEQSINVTCSVGFDGSVTGGGTGVDITNEDISPGDFSCIFVVPHGDWVAAPVAGDATKVDISLGANTVANEPCFGTVRGSWNNVTKKLTITNQTLPPVNPGDRTCTIHWADITIPNLNLS